MASTKAIKTVLILTRYFVKLTRSVVYRVRNGEDKVYLVTLNANGTAGCFCETDNEPCKASQYGRKCYHVKECQAKEAAREKPLLLTRAENEAYEARRDAVLAEERAPLQPLSREAYIDLYDVHGLNLY